MKEILSLRITTGLKKYLREQAEERGIKPSRYILTCLLKGASALAHEHGENFAEHIGKAKMIEYMADGDDPPNAERYKSLIFKHLD